MLSRVPFKVLYTLKTGPRESVQQLLYTRREKSPGEFFDKILPGFFLSDHNI